MKTGLIAAGEIVPCDVGISVLFLYAISKIMKQPVGPVKMPLSKILTHFLLSLCKQSLQ